MGKEALNRVDRKVLNECANSHLYRSKRFGGENFAAISGTIGGKLCLTRPPRLSDFGHDAQLWWVFYARYLAGGL